MSGNVVKFEPKVKMAEDFKISNMHLSGIPDSEINRDRDGQGPAIGSKAWQCGECYNFAFYITEYRDIQCYHCHRVQYF